VCARAPLTLTDMEAADEAVSDSPFSRGGEADRLAQSLRQLAKTVRGAQRPPLARRMRRLCWRGTLANVP
jgi:hypothetical protein